MKVLIYAFGSRGDIQPYLALAHALREAGHTPVLSASESTESTAADYGIDFVPRDDALIRLHLEDPDVQAFLMNRGEKGAKDKETKKKAVTKLRTATVELFPRMLDDIWAGAQAAGSDVDLVVHPHNPLDMGHHIAEKLGVPAVCSVLYPYFVPSRDYHSPLLKPGVNWPKLLNRLSHLPAKRMQLQKPAVEKWRTETLGLAARKEQHNRLVLADNSPVTVLNAFSRHVVPPASDWPEHVHTTGFWFLPARDGWTPPQRLTDFLSAGEQPVFIGFGSLKRADPVASGQVVLEAVRAAGVRAVVGTGWGGIEIADPPDDVLVVDDVPYDWLFPKVRAAVHAGGVGTMNAAMMAGIPQASCPFHHEQKLWGSFAHRLGVAPEPMHQRVLDAEAMAAAIRQLTTDQQMAARAKQLAAKLHGEDGTATAVSILEQVHQRNRAAVRTGS